MPAPCTIKWSMCCSLRLERGSRNASLCNGMSRLCNWLPMLPRLILSVNVGHNFSPDVARVEIGSLRPSIIGRAY